MNTVPAPAPAPAPPVFQNKSLKVEADRWLQQGNLGYARVANNALPSPRSSSPTPHVPRNAAVSQGSTPGAPSPGTPLNTPVPQGSTPGPPAGSPRNNVSSESGVYPRSPLPSLPLNQQGHQAIRVSDDEVRQSVDRGTAIGGHGGPVDRGAGGGVGRTGAEAGMGQPLQRGSPFQQRWVTARRKRVIGEGCGGGGRGGVDRILYGRVPWDRRPSESSHPRRAA